MDISINTPALFFPAISLVMLAYTNRFLGIAALVRNLHAQSNKQKDNPRIHGQIKNLRYRLRLIKQMQTCGVFSFLSCILSMYFIYVEQLKWAEAFFGFGTLTFTASLIISLVEIQVSTRALELELGDF